MKIEPATSVKTTSSSVNASLLQSVGSHSLSPENTVRVTPPRSVTTLAESELALEAGEWMFDADAIQETQENIGFALGGSMRSRSGNGQGASERSRPRNMIQRLASHVDAVSPDHIAELRQRIPGIEEVEIVDDLMNKMRKHQFDLGEMGLLLGSMLNESGLSAQKKQQLLLALSSVMESDEWIIQLFSRLEFGLSSPEALTDLRQLYQRAIDNQSDLLYWFSQFRKLTDRRRKLKTLIRALSFDLAAGQGSDLVRLEATITDLKKIVQFFTLEDHSQRLALKLGVPGLTEEKVSALLIDIVQQSWLYADWLQARIAAHLPTGHDPYHYAHGLMELVKLLPETCFEDSDQRTTITDTLLEYMESITLQE